MSFSNISFNLIFQLAEVTAKFQHYDTVASSAYLTLLTPLKKTYLYH